MRQIGLIILTMVMVCFCGCAHQYTLARQEAMVEPLPNNEVVELSADDVVIVMRKAGFTDDQILEYGVDFRNAMSSTGSAQIRVNRRVFAIFAVKDHRLHVSSILRGAFMYNLDRNKKPDQLS